MESDVVNLCGDLAGNGAAPAKNIIIFGAMPSKKTIL